MDCKVWEQKAADRETLSRSDQSRRGPFRVFHGVCLSMQGASWRTWALKDLSHVSMYTNMETFLFLHVFMYIWRYMCIYLNENSIHIYICRSRCGAWSAEHTLCAPVVRNRLDERAPVHFWIKACAHGQNHWNCKAKALVYGENHRIRSESSDLC